MSPAQETTWQVRHEGSPESVDGLTAEQVVEGLAEGSWEPTDEVRASGEADWQVIENHPQFADAAFELEPPPPRTYDDETRLDMNALIDVTLVLLIFFIILASYAALQKRFEAPKLTAGAAGPAEVTREQIAESMIHVVMKRQDGRTVILLQGREVPVNQLEGELLNLVSANRNKLLLEHDGSIPHGEVVQVQDAAKGAGITRVLWLVPEEELKK
jgi:biopolymer transport protein ExbD